MEYQGVSVSCRCGMIACQGEKCNPIEYKLVEAQHILKQFKNEQKKL